MKRRKWVSVLAGTAILVVSTAVMLGLSSMKEPPAEATKEDAERTLRVEILEVQPADVPVTIKGYGEVRVRKEVAVAPEVSGMVTRTHANLVVGGLIPAGQLLFEIESSPYEARVEEGRAQVAQWDLTTRRLEIEERNDRARVKTLRRSKELAQAQLDRARDLRGERIGNQTDVDVAERAFNQTTDAVDQLQRQLAVYPVRVEEAKQSQAATRARLKLAEIDLKKTKVVAPFNARVTKLSMEQGQFVAAGLRVLTVADDSLLEVPVKLDARDSRQWLQFSSRSAAPGVAWFDALEPAACRVRWTEETNGHTWEGRLDRVEAYDPATRTLTVVVTVTGEAAKTGEGLPLVAGMFCEVSIPGRAMEAVYALPQWAVTVDSTVYLSREARLNTVPVHVVRMEGDTVYINAGLRPSDQVITTRLINPLENTLLDVFTMTDEGEDG